MVIRLPQPIALYLEFMLSNGISADQLMKMNDKNDFSKLHTLQHPFLTPDNFIEFFMQHEEEIKGALSKGYEMKFTTFKGLVNFISTKYQLTAGEDFHVGTNELDKIPLRKTDADELQRIIASSWRIVSSAPASQQTLPLYRIELKYYPTA